jgi:putative peptidoglycan lipid II flippase
MELTLVLAIPCLVAFIVVPDLIMLALFSRGAFTAADASASASTLAAYSIGLLPFVLLRAVSSTFLARGDTATPVKALLVSVVINVALKIVLLGRYAQVGLAFATSVGVWVNFVLLTWFAMRAGFMSFDTRLKTAALKLAAAGLTLAAVLALAAPPVIRICASFGGLRHVAALLILAALGGVVYGGAVTAMFGSRWLAGLRRRRARAAL